MDLTDITTIKKLCRDFGILPSKKKGQNFLIDKNVLTKLIASAELKPTDTVLEVGPGFGVITQELIGRVHQVIAVESDKKMVSYLQTCFGHHKNLQIIPADILKLNISSLQALKPSSPKIISNLPYNITSRFLRNFLSGWCGMVSRTSTDSGWCGMVSRTSTDASNKRVSYEGRLTSPSNKVKPQEMTLIIQREVADRICAQPGGDMSLLSLSVQFYSQPEIITYIKPKSFWPQPEVDSAIIKISNIKPRPEVNEKKFFRLARLGFSSRRKMLKNNLASGLKIGESEVKKTLKSVGLDAKVRAQDLSVEDWIKLARALEP